MTRTEFEILVREGIDAIPEKFLKLLDNVAIVVENEPTASQRVTMRLGKYITLFGLYEGVPQARRGSNYSWVLPDKITIFMVPIIQAAANPDDIRRMVRDTVWHEVAHHFGMDEARVRKAEQKRRQK